MVGAQSYKYSGGSNAAEKLHQVQKLASNSIYQRSLHIPKTYFQGMSQSLFKVNSENFPLKDYSSFDSPRYDCVLFVSLIKLNGESIAVKNVLFMSLVKVNSENFSLKDYSSFDPPRYDCVLFVSLIKLNGESIAAKNILFMSLVMVNSENLPLRYYSCFD